MTRAIGAWCIIVAIGGCGSSNNSNSHPDMSMGSENDLSANEDMAKEQPDSAVAIDAAMSPDLKLQDAAPSFVDSGVMGTFNYQGYNPGGAGTDLFTIAINHDTNTITTSDIATGNEFTITGTIETTTSGFLKCNFTKGCDGAACTPAVVASINAGGGTRTLPFSMHGVEAAGAFLILETDGQGGSGVVVGVGQSDCVAGMLGDYNLIHTGPSDTANVATGTAYEQATLAGTPTLVAIPVDTAYNISASPSPHPTPSPGPCSSGVISIAGGAAAGGASIVESGAKGVTFVENGGSSDNVTLVGMFQNGITLAQLEGRTYTGFYFTHQNNNPDTNGYVSLHFPAATAAGTARVFNTPDDVDTNTVDPTNVSTVTLNGVTNGIVSATVTGSGSAVLKGAAMQSGSSVILVFVGEQEGDGTNIINLVLISN